MIKSVKGPVTMEIYDSKNHTKVVHTNHLQHCCVPGQHDGADLNNLTNGSDCLEWTPSSVEHVILLQIEQNMLSHYPKDRGDHQTITHHKLLVKLKSIGASVVLITY